VLILQKEIIHRGGGGDGGGDDDDNDMVVVVATCKQPSAQCNLLEPGTLLLTLLLLAPMNRFISCTSTNH
jgi:hypothetical protein